MIPWSSRGPGGIKAKGEVRNQYHHATDVAATVLDGPGSKCRSEYNGVKRYPLNGVSMRSSLRRPQGTHHSRAAVLRDAGYPRYLERRLEGRRATRPDQQQGPLRSGPLGALPRRGGPFESTNLADQNPDKLKELIDVWFEEAKNNFILPWMTGPPPRC